MEVDIECQGLVHVVNVGKRLVVCDGAWPLMSEWPKNLFECWNIQPLAVVGQKYVWDLSKRSNGPV